MQTILEIVLSNAVLATGLALLAATVARLCRRPALVHALWLLVLLKLITPPLVPVSVSWLNLGSIPLRAGKPATAAVTTPGGDAASTWNMAGDAGPADQSAERVFFLESTEDRTAEETPAPVGPANIAELLAAWVQEGAPGP